MPRFRDSEVYDERERVVLEYAAAVNRTPAHVDDELAERLRSLFTSVELTELAGGGGRVKAARRPIVGARKTARFLLAVAPTVPRDATMRVMPVNGQPGAVVFADGRPYTAMALDVLDGRIAGIQLVLNPDKLTSLRPLPVD